MVSLMIKEMNTTQLFYLKSQSNALKEKKMLKKNPIGRLSEHEDIAGAVLYFAAPISKWISGQVIFVNGGGIQTLE